MKKLNVDLAGGSNSRDVAQPSIRHQPATALPWNISIRGNVTNDRRYIHIKPDSGFAVAEVCGADDTNAAYIAHAANAYPKLVEALRKYAERDELRAFERGQREPEFQHATESAARALLRELGEEAQ